MRLLIHLFCFCFLSSVCYSPISFAAKSSGLSALSTRPAAPDFALRDIGGNTIRLSDLRNKVVVINFWATWCPPCRAEMPSLQRLWESLEDQDFVILAVNVGETKEKIAKFYFASSTPLTFNILLDPENKTSEYWPLRGLPATFIVDRQGKVSHVVHGAKRWDTPQIIATLKTLIAAEDESANQKHQFALTQ